MDDHKTAHERWMDYKDSFRSRHPGDWQSFAHKESVEDVKEFREASLCFHWDALAKYVAILKAVPDCLEDKQTAKRVIDVARDAVKTTTDEIELVLAEADRRLRDLAEEGNLCRCPMCAGQCNFECELCGGRRKVSDNVAKIYHIARAKGSEGRNEGDRRRWWWPFGTVSQS